MVMGSWMRFREWREALGIAEGIVTFPHHERSNPDSVVQDIRNSAPQGMTVIGVDGMTGCLGGSGEWTVTGDGNVTVYRDGVWKRYSSGDVFTV
jgi:hypothetical protein